MAPADLENEQVSGKATPQIEFRTFLPGTSFPGTEVLHRHPGGIALLLLLLAILALRRSSYL